MDACAVCGGPFSYGLVTIFRLHTKWGSVVCSTDCERSEQ